MPYICERVTKSLGIFSVGSYSVFLVVDTFFLELDKLEIIKACHDSQKCAIQRTERSSYDVDNVIPKFFLRLASPNFTYVARFFLIKVAQKQMLLGSYHVAK